MDDGESETRGDLDAIAAELCALPPAEFTAARNARAALIADRTLANAVKALRKPTVSAWAVDLLAREGQLGEALELSAALREAQDDLDAAELARLGRQRRALVAALAQQAAELARAHGVAVSSAAQTDVEKTINAAVMDAEAAAAVMTARLATPLEAGSFERAALAEAVNGTLPGRAESAPPDDLAERRARKAAEKALREAERAAGQADRELAALRARRDKVRERAEMLAERTEDLRRDLARIEAEAAHADEELAGLDAQHREAASRAEAAAKAAARARAAVE